MLATCFACQRCHSHRCGERRQQLGLLLQLDPELPKTSLCSSCSTTLFSGRMRAVEVVRVCMRVFCALATSTSEAASVKPKRFKIRRFIETKG